MMHLLLLLVIAISAQISITPPVEWYHTFGPGESADIPTVRGLKYPGCLKWFGADFLKGEDAVLVYGGVDKADGGDFVGRGVLWKYDLVLGEFELLWKKLNVASPGVPSTNVGDLVGLTMAIVDETHVVIFGGHRDLEMYNLLWKCKIYAERDCQLLSGVTTPNVWIDDITPHPPSMAYHSMVFSSVYQFLYVYGGRVSTPPGSFNDVWRYDLVNDKWLHLAGNKTINTPRSANSPGGLVYHSMVLSEDEKSFYIFGGSLIGNDEINQDLWRFDSSNAQWTLLNPYSKPLATRSHSMLRYMGHLLFYGGESTDGILRDLWAFDLGTDQWELLNNGSLALDYNVPSLLTGEPIDFTLGALSSHFMTLNDEGNVIHLYGGELINNATGTRECNGNWWSFQYRDAETFTTEILSSTLGVTTTEADVSSISVSEETTIEEYSASISAEVTTIEVTYPEVQLVQNQIQIACGEIGCSSLDEEFMFVPFLNCLEQSGNSYIAYFGYVQSNRSTSQRVDENFITLGDQCVFPSAATQFTSTIRNFLISVEFDSSVGWNLNGSSIFIYSDNFEAALCPNTISVLISLGQLSRALIPSVHDFLAEFVLVDRDEISLDIVVDEKRSEELLVVAEVQLEHNERDTREIISDLSILSDHPIILESHLSRKGEEFPEGTITVEILPSENELYISQERDFSEETEFTDPEAEINNPPSQTVDTILVIVTVVAVAITIVTVSILLITKTEIESLLCHWDR